MIHWKLQEPTFKRFLRMDGWMRFTLFQRYVSHIRRTIGDNERLCAMEPHLQFKRFPPQAGLETESTRSAGQRLTYLASAAPISLAVARYGAPDKMEY